MRIKNLTYIFLLLMIGQSCQTGREQELTPLVEASIANDSIPIGGQTRILFSISTPPRYRWQWPELETEIAGKIEIVSHSRIDTIRQSRSAQEQLLKTLVITSFDTGFIVVPPFKFQYQSPEDTLWNHLETKALLLYVQDVDVDLSLPIRDLKAPLKAPLTFREVFPWILLAILIAAGIWYYLRYRKKLKEKPVVAIKPQKPKIPPHTLALDALDGLRKKKLWQMGRIKEYHSELTDILRHYIEARFFIQAVEMTTSEIRNAIIHHEIPSQARGNLLRIFERADLVKFAKFNPGLGEHEESFMLAVEFVRATIPLAVASTQASNEEAGKESDNNQEAK
jgi:hypothetical protein